MPPRPSGPVADYAGVLDSETKLKISALARALWVDEKFGLIVATVSDIGDVSPERYAADLYSLWGAGVRASPEDALLLLSVDPPDVQIYVGSGARRYLPGTLTRQLLSRYGTPYFTVGDYNRGLLSLTQELALSVRGTARRRAGIPERFSLFISKFWLLQFHDHTLYRLIVIGAMLTVLLLLFIPYKRFRHLRRFDYCGSAFGGDVGSSAFGSRIFS